MRYRFQTFCIGLMALLVALTLGLGASQAKHALGGYQLFEQVESGIEAPILLASLGNFDWSVKTASEYANATKGTVPSYTTSQLQHEFKHAGDFGVNGNWNKANGEAFQSAINSHISDPTTQVIQGSYRNQPATLHYNANSGNVVFTKPDGSFWGGWKLSPAQVQNITTHGNLQ